MRATRPDVRTPAGDGARRPNPEVRLALCAAGEIWGGVERFIVTTAPALRASGMDPLVILFYEGLLAERLREQGLRVHVVAARPKYDRRIIGDVREVMREAGINLLHVHGYKATIVGSLAARGLSVKVVKTEHGVLEPFPGWGAIWSHSRLAATTLVERIASRYLTDARVFVSRDMHRHLGSRVLSAAHRIIYNGIDPSGLSAHGGNRAETTRFDVGIVGRIDKVKGHEVLLRAFACLRHLPDVHLHVLGAGPLEARCQRLASELGLDDVVHFHGFEPAVHARMAKLDLLVIPSLSEGLPYVLLEAMYLKVPVVASRVGGLREVLEDEECGVLVPASDVERLAGAIEALYRDRRRGGALAERAHALVRRQYLADRMVQQYGDLFRQLLVH